MPGVLTGLIPACHTPFDRDGRLNLAIVERQAALSGNQGLRGVFVAGTTGEFASLTVDERKALCERWMEVAGDYAAGRRSRRPQLPGRRDRAGGPCAAGGSRGGRGDAPQLFQAGDRARPGRVLHPDRRRGRSAAVLLLSHPEHDGRASAHGRVSPRGAVPHSQSARPEVLARRPGRPSGLRRRSTTARYDVLFGFDEALLAGLCLGVRGAVGSTYNFAGRHYLRLIRAFESGDLAAARAAQLEATEMVKTLASFGFMAASKAVMSLIGVDCGPVRPPLRNLTAEQLAALADKLRGSTSARGRSRGASEPSSFR